jgi:ATP-dependent Clp protease protease subunit
MSRNREDLDRWFDFSVYAPKRLLYIGDGEGEVDANMHELAIKGLTFLDSWSEAPITIYLNTLGGDWYHGMGIYDTIQSLRSHVTIIVTGYATSMGSLILQAGDHRVMGRHSVLMIHDGSEDLHSDCKSVEAWADQTKKVRKRMYEIYLERIRQTRSRYTMKQVENLCSHDTIFTPEEAIGFGLADAILEKIF